MRKKFATADHCFRPLRVKGASPRGGSPVHAAALGLALSLVFASPAPATEQPAGRGHPGHAVDLVGTWYVLIHYREEVPRQGEVLQWEDRIWRFERDGARLVWSEFPKVVFQDPSGRFETLAGDRSARTLGAWQPTPEQLEEIARGLEIDGRGARSKRLLGSPERGYRSAGGLRPDSAAVIGYHEIWRIDGLPSLPVFERDDAMGSGRTTSLTGHTRYATGEVRAEGAELRGEYERDGLMRGTFRMWRMGTRAKSVADDDRSEASERP